MKSASQVCQDKDERKISRGIGTPVRLFALRQKDSRPCLLQIQHCKTGTKSHQNVLALLSI